MMETLTFSQSLTKVMHKHHLTLANLSTMIGSRADLKRVLTDDATHARRCRLYEKLVESQLLDEEDYRQLAHSLEISRMGIEKYRFQTAIEEILAGQEREASQEIMIDSGISLRDRLATVQQAEKMEILCFNCCFHSLFNVLAPLFGDKEYDIRMRHFIQSDSSINAAAEYVAAALPLLFDSRYTAYDCPGTHEIKIPSLGGNFLLIRALVDHTIHELFFVLTSSETACELANASACHLYSFLSKVLQATVIQPVPIKEVHPYPLDFTSLCMTFLSHELNRATYYIGCDLCFHQTPTKIALDAFRDKGFSSENEMSRIISRTLSIHEQRYQNQYRKRKSTYRIMTKTGCERFLKTGETTDHFIGFRAFTPEERKEIFGNMLQAAKQNPHFIPLLLKNEGFAHRYNLVCYEKMGISIDAKDTDYDIFNGYRSVFLMLPEFTKQYLDYYMEILVAEKCHSRTKSLELLEEMYQNFLAEHRL